MITPADCAGPTPTLPRGHRGRETRTAGGRGPADMLQTSSIALAHGALLDTLFVAVVMHDTLHEDARRVDLVGVDLAHFDQILDLDHGGLRRGRHYRIGIARGLAEHEVALSIRFPGVDDRQIGEEAALHDIGLAVKVAGLLAL